MSEHHRIATLFDAIAHGDDEHRAWLKEAIENHFAGEPVPPALGKGTKERLLEDLRAAQGYLLNAKIDLETGAPKKTAINTLDGGIKMVRAAIIGADPSPVNPSQNMEGDNG